MCITQSQTVAFFQSGIFFSFQPIYLTESICHLLHGLFFHSCIPNNQLLFSFLIIPTSIISHLFSFFFYSNEIEKNLFHIMNFDLQSPNPMSISDGTRRKFISDMDSADQNTLYTWSLK